VLYTFTGDPDGSSPAYGDLIFDLAGDLYGTTFYGGQNGRGTIFDLTLQGNGWTESVLYSLSGSDGASPSNSVIFGNAGNLYGTTSFGGSGDGGTVFELTNSGASWTETCLVSFQYGSYGDILYAGLIFDTSGNLYGATSNSGTGGGGTVFELTPSGNCSWTLKTLYSFTDGAVCGPRATLVMDGAGNVYGTTWCDGAYDRAASSS
jgi:uncharacterized repeat protein (TIGR03803 family)